MPSQYTPKLSKEDRFWSKVDKQGDCWIWTATRNSGGYGRARMKGRRYLTHRLVYMWLVGPIPDELHVLHRCDNPPCCNPDHLFLGTDMDNVHDAITKGRHVRGEKAGRSVLCEADVIGIRSCASNGVNFVQIARRYGISHRTARSVVRRETWKHVP